MPTLSFEQRRGQLEDYFDRTAMRTWERLTSDAPVSGIRATVRAGRDAMRRTLVGWLPEDLTGRRVLDAGAGTGAMTADLAARGASVVAVDVSGSLLEVARERLSPELADRVSFHTGDMLDPAWGEFDHVVAMDSLIHYATTDVVGALEKLAGRARESVVFTFAPRTPLLAAMHAAGRLFPRSNRAPAIEPVAERRLAALLDASPLLGAWRLGRGHRVQSGFYTSHGLELCRQ